MVQRHKGTEVQSDLNERLSSLQAIVFDLDDTLYPEVDYVHSGYRAVGRYLAQRYDLDAPAVAQQCREAFSTGDRSRVFNAVLVQQGLPDTEQHIAELVHVYREHRPELTLDSRVRDLLELLKQQYKLGLITDGFLPAQRLKIESLGISDLFNHIICTEELGRAFWKPAPLAFERMSEALSCEGPACCYVADNPVKDFIAPNQLGWLTIQVQHADRVHIAEPGQSSAPAMHRIDRLMDLNSLLPQRGFNT